MLTLVMFAYKEIRKNAYQRGRGLKWPKLPYIIEEGSLIRYQ